ncbi:MAG: hypothetical protein IH987_00975, partial [Planctomycetes bacterium]|nr:hypothetical protein [Planctomycetota bacterium]
MAISWSRWGRVTCGRWRMNWCSEFADRIERDAPLGRLTWFRLGGPVSYLFHPKDGEELARMVVRAKDTQTPLKVLGAGANVLIRDDMIDTAGSIAAAAECVKQNGALDIYAAATHGVLSGQALERIE